MDLVRYDLDPSEQQRVAGIFEPGMPVERLTMHDQFGAWTVIKREPTRWLAQHVNGAVMVVAVRDDTAESYEIARGDLARALERIALRTTYWRTALEGEAISRHCDWLASRPGGARLMAEDRAFSLAQLVGSTFPLAGFFDVTFDRCNFTMATVSALEAERCTFLQCELEFAHFNHARLTGCVFRSTHAVGVLFQSAIVRGGGFPESSLARTDWDQAAAYDVDFRGVCFVRARLGGARFSHCDLSGANFEDAVLAGAQFDQCDLRQAKHADLSGAILLDCQV